MQGHGRERIFGVREGYTSTSPTYVCCYRKRILEAEPLFTRVPTGIRPSLILLLVLFFLPSFVRKTAAQQGDVSSPEPVPVRYAGSEGELDVPAPRISDPAIRVDGHLDEPDWSQGAVLHSFTQYEPVEGAPASQPTEVRILVGADALYFGVRACDDDPDGVRATLAERDNVGSSDDYVRFVLDTFHDRRRAYVFLVNPLGIQQDGVWNEGGQRRFGPPIDYNPDFVWDSRGVVEDWGYSVELRIPFKSLRFPDEAVQSWGLNVMRRIQRTGYEEAWAPITEEVSNQLAQAGNLQDLRGLDPGLFLEMNPVVTGKRLGHYDEESDGLVHDDPTGDFGMNLTYGLTSNLTLDGTYNPDFSQVEADAGQISVNERFALFFPEKRPFFLEGTEIFSLPKRLIYTRSIVSPVAGAKLTGKVGSFNLGYLGAVDDVGGENPVVNILRVRRDLGTSSTVGLAFTDRTLDSRDYSRMAAADARLVFAGRYTLSLLGSGSWMSEDDASPSGSLLNARFERSGRTLSFNAEVYDVSPGFRAGNGFIRRVGDTQVEGEVRLNRYGSPGELVERWGPSLEFQGFWNHDAFWSGEKWEELQVEAGGSVSFRNNLTFFLNYSRRAFSFPEGDYAGLHRDSGTGGEPRSFAPDQDLFSGLDGLRIFLWMNTWERLRGRLRAEWRETPIFERSLGVPVESADAWIADGSFTLFPVEGLTSEIGIRHESLFRKRDGSRYSSATIPRIKTQYQFTRHLFLRATVEYASQDRGDLLHPVTGDALLHCSQGECSALEGSAIHDLYVELLATYEPSPGTVFYLGYSRDMRDSGAFRFREVTSRSDGIFTKLSYRFRF